MADGAGDDDDQGRGRPGGSDPGDFGRDLRRFALDSHRILGRPDSSPDEVSELHRRAWSLLFEAPGEPSAEVRRWLLAARRAVGAGLLSRSLEESESGVA